MPVSEAVKAIVVLAGLLVKNHHRIIFEYQWQDFDYENRGYPYIYSIYNHNFSNMFIKL